MMSTQTATATPSLSILRAEEAFGNNELVQQWQAAVDARTSVNALYSSPTWCEHLRHVEPADELLVAVVRGAKERLIGACPLRVQRFPLAFDVWSRILVKTTLRAVVVPEGAPELPREPDLYRRFFEGVFRAVPHCDCVYMPAVPTDSHAWELLRGEGGQSREYFAYLPYGVRPWYRLELEGGFEHYLRELGGHKSRYKLRRHVRDLKEHGGGSLNCVRVTTEEQVPHFLRAAAAVSARSWQSRVLGPRVVENDQQAGALKDLARLGVLRSYLLEAGGQPFAFVIGRQFKGVFHYAEIGFDESQAALSPGTVLLYLLIEDLFKHDSPTVLNFGIGDAAYKRRFGNRQTQDAAVILFRRTLRNHVRRAAHAGFSTAVEWAKKVLRRKASPGTEADTKSVAGERS